MIIKRSRKFEKLGGGDKYFRKIEKTQDKNAIFYIKIDPDDSTPASTSFGYVMND